MSPAQLTALREAVRLIADSARNFKSRQVAEARRLIESVIQLEEHADVKKK